MAGAPIEALREGMQIRYDELMSDQEMRSKAKLSVITFGGGAQQTALVPLRSFVLPTIQAFGARTLGAALHLLAQSLAEDVVLNTRERHGDYAPLVFIMLGGAVEDEWRSAAKRLGEFRYNAKPLMVGLACGPKADMEALAAVCTTAHSIAETSGAELRSYYQFISGSAPASNKAH